MSNAFPLGRVAAGIWLLAVTLVACGDAAPKEERPTATAEQQTIQRIVVATGTVEPEGEVQVRPRIPGIVERIRVTAGEEVEAGQVLVEIERELIEAQVTEARALVQAADVEHRFAKIQLERSQELQRKGASSDSQLDVAQSRHQTARASRSRARAALSTLEVQLRYATIRAPQAGKVLDVPVELGAAVSPVTSVTGGTVLLTLAGTDRLHLKGLVDENEIARVALGQRALVRTGAFGDRAFEGKVREIAPLGDRKQNVTYFEVEIDITDPEAKVLRPRMSGDADIIAETIEDALVIPETALRYAGDQLYVNVVVPGEDAAEERRDIEVGIVDGNQVEILSGLSLGEKVSLQ